MIIRLTKSFVDKAVVPENKDQIFYRDDQLKGFALRVTAGGVKSFVVETSINNRVRRFTLGKYGKLTVDQARREAQIKLGEIARGVNPIAEKKAKKLRGVTLNQAFEDYLRARKSLKPSTALDYKRVLHQAVPDWHDKPLMSITENLIIKRHSAYGASNSMARANLVMRLLRAIFNFAVNYYKDSDGTSIVKLNPVKILSATRSWYKIERRQTVIKQHQLANWYKGVVALKEVMPHDRAEMWQDYFMLILFTGLRRQEASSLAWSDVDLDAKTFTVHDTKNRDSHTLPMSDLLYDLFLRRKNFAQNNFVFSAGSASGYVAEPRKAMWKVTEVSGVSFTLHDLRRTFITIAESLDIPAYALKRLLNHKMNHDITSGYIIADPERLRKPMQQITSYIVGLFDPKLQGKVVELRPLSVTNNNQVESGRK